jgi:hypothetical protein
MMNNGRKYESYNYLCAPLCHTSLFGLLFALRENWHQTSCANSEVFHTSVWHLKEMVAKPKSRKVEQHLAALRLAHIRV